MSEKSEALLQELVDLHKQEAKRNQIHRWMHFLFGTMPAFILIVVSLWGGYLFLKSAQALIEEAPSLIESGVSDLIPSLPPAFGSDLPK